MKEFFIEWKSLIGFVLSASTFTLGCYHINVPAIELGILFTILGICTYSWSTYVKEEYFLLAVGMCSFITIMCSIIVLDVPAFLSALVAVSFQTLIIFFLEIKNELI